MTRAPILRLFSLVDSFKTRIKITGPIPQDLISDVERILSVKLPDSYIQFLGKYGTISIDNLKIFGICLPIDQEPSLVWAINGFWIIAPDAPKNLIPIRLIDNTREFLCIKCQKNNFQDNDNPIVRWHIDLPLESQDLSPLADDFATYVCDELIEIKHNDIGLQRMEEHINRFEQEYLAIGKLPRNNVWRPYRFCSQDAVLGLTVVRHSVDNNCLEVDVCLTSDIPEFEDGSGAKVTTSFLLSEAYKCGGTMEIRFSDYVEGRHVPLAICELAHKYNIKLEHTSEGRITPNEAKNFYVAITEFSPKLREYIDILADSGNLARERACYVIHNGLWTRPELEHLILGSNRVDKLLGGEARPEQRLLYQNDILHARAAIMGGFLDRKLAKKEQFNAAIAEDLEDDVRPIEILFDPTYYAKIYSCPEELPIPWIFSNGNMPQDIKTRKDLLILLRARDSEDLTINLLKDLTQATNMKSLLRMQIEDYFIGCLVPRDFEEIQSDLRREILLYASSQGIYILICPETSIALDTEANKRLVSSRIIRE